MHSYFAIDLGATSGRTILGTLSNGHLTLEEITRFPNAIIKDNGHFRWDFGRLFDEILRGLKEIARRGIAVESIGIDTWGVDVALFGSDGKLICNPLSYRDTITAGEPARFFAENIDAERLYALTGSQTMEFNTLFQLSAMKRAGFEPLTQADKILFLPCALAYMLTGDMVTEYTIASTSEMLNATTRCLEPEILDSLGLDADKFPPLVMPGTKIGTLSAQVQAATGLGAVPVVAVAGHDTAAAVAAIPAASRDFAFLSSGTWSLMGVELETPSLGAEVREMAFTHEGGVCGTIRFLKNICGMWLLESCRKEWEAAGVEADYASLITSAEAAEPFRSLIFPDSPCFANPQSMLGAIKDYCTATGQPVPETPGQVTRCIFDSLTLRYKQIFGQLQTVAPYPLNTLHVIGGGSRNQMLCRMTADALGVPVVAGPTECTAAGNIQVQAMAAGELKGLSQMREIIINSIPTQRYLPSGTAAWDAPFERFLALPTSL